ncbi:serine hydrolase [Stenotrophomonas sp. ATCM1_4]|jgi:beta-lactamase class A|uniref:class A beta-lactamase n=1 Tax=unclassified Stenotrophomonas TaxID=196198 RepID=UPI0010453F1F|nr:class A beta-lactamase [Stenotrophomonas sp. ATCM1_4]TDB27571.1 serine hydrolase [Stenotrophomonas sp. ATCM1_4]
MTRSASPRRLHPRRPLLAAALLASLWLPGTLLARSAPAAPLQAEAQRLASLLPGGELGAAIVHLESGRSVYINGDRPFPMASTMKVPVAVHILALVDEGTLSLQQQVTLKADDIYPEMGGPMDLHLSAGSAITVRDLLHMMITVSDNNATDILIRLGGGTAAVDARMRALGIDGLRVDRYIWELLANYRGNAASQAQPMGPAAYAELSRGERSEEQRRSHTNAWNADPRDTSTARAMTLLLEKTWKGQVLSPASLDVLQAIMRDTRTGTARLPGMLPRDTPVAHKTGTVGDVINDVGVITLPGGRGHAVISVFVQSRASSQERDAAIAQLARAAHDYFLFVP